LVKWEDLRVGDIIKVLSDEAIPADIIILYSPLEMGMLNIETTNLDGETNLKGRQALQFDNIFDFVNDPSSFTGFVTIDNPNPNLYVFNGTLSISGEQAIPIDNNNTVLRSCSLRNTPYILGLVAYTGKDSKIMMNSGKSPFKRTKLEQLLNVFVFIAFLFQMLFCVFCSFSVNLFQSRVKDHWYLPEDNSPFFTRSILKFLTFIILYQVYYYIL
jgi:magnesium-transporting ATPase (P-type)